MTFFLTSLVYVVPYTMYVTVESSCFLDQKKIYNLIEIIWCTHFFHTDKTSVHCRESLKKHKQTNNLASVFFLDFTFDI